MREQAYPKDLVWSVSSLLVCNSTDLGRDFQLRLCQYIRVFAGIS
jgi:hypothetical protein